MTAAMVELGYNAEKLPLGKLSSKHIQRGYAVLQKISKQLDGKKKNLTALSNDFYTLIPHDFGMRRPEILNNKKLLSKKLEMITSLADIVVATKLIKQARAGANPVDSHYGKLKCDIQPLEKKSKEFKMLETYVKNTHAKTHNRYTLEIMDIFALDRQGEEKRFEPYADDHNRQLLWHGSRITNFCGIISQGLRIAPPEAPVTGYMFGKGVYFADLVSKSANYCGASKASPVGGMLLCEVALGDMNPKYYADYWANKLPPGKLSTKGMGKTAPDPSGTVVTDDGVIVPSGKCKAVDLGTASSLLYNEFIVYDTAQIRMKYFFKMKFNYKW